MSVRAKFRCVKAEHSVYGPSVRYTFAPQYEPDRPEDERFAKATPSGELWMVVDNPAVDFALGGQYYLDFTRVEE